MAKAHDFKLALARVIEPTGGPGVELAAGRGTLRRSDESWRRAWPHWDYAAELLLKAAETTSEVDIDPLTAQMDYALCGDGWP